MYYLGTLWYAKAVSAPVCKAVSRKACWVPRPDPAEPATAFMPDIELLSVLLSPNFRKRDPLDVRMLHQALLQKPHTQVVYLPKVGDGFVQRTGQTPG